MTRFLDASGNVYLQQLMGEGWLPLWRFITHLGDGTTLFLLVLLFAWCVALKTGLRIAWAGSLTGVVVGLLKLVVQEPRPFYTELGVQPWSSASGFGMPSGHAAAATVVFGLLAVYACQCTQRAWPALVAVILIISVGLSRIVLGVHTPLQVVLGVVSGLLIGLFSHHVGRTFHSMHFPTTRQQFQSSLLLIAATGIAIAVSFAVLFNRASEFLVPAFWQKRYEEAQTLSNSVQLSSGDALVVSNTGLAYIMALFFGTWLAMLLATRWLNLEFDRQLAGMQLAGVIIFGIFTSAVVILLLTHLPFEPLRWLVIAALPPWLFAALPKLMQRF